MRVAPANFVAFSLMERRFDSNDDGFLIEGTEKEVNDRPEGEMPNVECENPELEGRAQRPILPVTGIKVTDPHGSDLVKVVLGPFARDSIEDRFGPHLNRGVQAALRHYARRVRSARTARHR